MIRLTPQSLLVTAIAASISAAISSSVLAHHSAAAFDTNVESTIKGTVTEYSFRNPHVYLTLNVKKEDGSTVSTEVEAGAGSVVAPLGFTRDSIKVGDVVSVVGNPAKREPDKLFLGRELYKEDGSYLPLNISSRSTYVETNAVATSIEGTWFPPRTSFFGFLGNQGKWAVTDAGKAAIQQSASLPTPQKDCQPIGEPALLFYPVANVIEVFDDRVEMHIDWLDSERTIWLDGRAHPAASETFPHGHSVGHFEGTTLVVDTTNFAPNPIGFSMALPSGTGKHLTESFAISPDGKGMVYSGKMEDPQYLSAAAEWSGTWQYRPEMKASNEPCDIGIAQKFLDD
ncbi:MAG: DUF6152 family protein [Pseudomonadota bacterium]